jgi:threonine 3-dehydrogenase
MNGSMKCIVKASAGPGCLELQEKPIPSPTAGEVLIKVHLAAVCGTDVHIKEWADFAAARMTPPVTIGHEFCGEIIEVGKGVSESRIGELVSAESHVACYACPLCLDGKANLCLNTKVIGLHFDGCFAEYVTIPAVNAVVCNPSISIENNAILEPLGVAVHSATKCEIGGKTVAVVGCGPIGLMTVGVVKKMGARKIICVEPNDYRAKTACPMGADLVVNPLREDVVQKVLENSDGLGVDIVMENSGNIHAIQAATKYVIPGGEMVIAGLPSREVPLNFAEVFYRGVNLYGIGGREIYHTWKVMGGLLEAGLDVSACVSHTLPLEKYEAAFELIESGQALKILLRP